MKEIVEFIEIFFGHEGIVATVAFILFSLFGMTIIKIATYSIKKKKFNVVNHPNRMKFDWEIWKDDNTIDFILAFMVAFAAFRFFPDALSFLQTKFEVPQMTDKMAYGLLLGVFFQFIFHKLMNNVSLEDFKKH